jgi:hypothetical protein
MPFDEGGLKFKFLYEPQIFVKEFFSPYLKCCPNPVPRVVMIQFYRTGIGPRFNYFAYAVDIICDDTIVLLLDATSILRDNFLDCGSCAGINTCCVACSRSDVST